CCRPSRRYLAVQSRAHVRQWSWCSARPGPRTHVVQLGGCTARLRSCCRRTSQSRTENDPSADRRGAEAGAGVEAEAATVTREMMGTCKATVDGKRCTGNLIRR